MSTADFFQRFTELNIVIIGDIMIDRYLDGSVNRISPEAPVPVVRLRGEDNRLGGAANVALNIQAMGAKPHLFSVIGADENGRMMQALLPNASINAKYLQQDDSRCTTVKTRVLAQHQQLLRVDREDTHAISQTVADRLLTSLRQLLEQKDIHLILFQDYNKGLLTPYLIRETILEALRQDIPTAVDPKFDNFWAYKHVTLFKPNLREIQQQLDRPIAPQQSDLDYAAGEIRRRLDNTYTIITLSEKGLYLNTKQGSNLMPTQARRIADVCGAGDTVISVAALGLAAGLDLTTLSMLANLAGGQVCERVGVVPVDAQQLQQEYDKLC